MLPRALPEDRLHLFIAPGTICLAEAFLAALAVLPSVARGSHTALAALPCHPVPHPLSHALKGSPWKAQQQPGTQASPKNQSQKLCCRSEVSQMWLLAVQSRHME